MYETFTFDSDQTGIPSTEKLLLNLELNTKATCLLKNECMKDRIEGAMQVNSPSTVFTCS